MTDLEKLWNDLPASVPPVDGVLRAGRAAEAARRRRAATRPLVAAGTVFALSGAFMAGTLVDGTDGPPAARSLDARPAAFQADLDPAASCDELLTSYRDRGLAQVTAWGWDGGAYKAFNDSVTAGGVLPGGMYDFRGAPMRAASATGTNVQEASVDEPDTVKTDGSRLVRLRGSDLQVFDATGDSMRKVSTLHLPKLDNGELLLSGDTVVAIGADRVSARDERTGQRRGSRVLTISLEDEDSPVTTSDVTYSARVLSVRQHGTVARLVLASGLPPLDFVEPRPGKISRADAIAANRRTVRTSTIEDWLPTYDTGGGPQRLVDCTDVAIPSDEVGLDTVSVVGLDLGRPTEPRAIGLAGATTIAYESADHLYLATGPAGSECFDCMVWRSRSFLGGGTSYVFDFELDGADARHVASGEIEGSIADRWSLDEAGDVLRVAVGPSSETGRFNSVVTLRRDGTDLAEIGRLDGIGANEEIKGVRWFDDLAIIVTYREIDPLFTIDLSDPATPSLLGSLKIPGFSDYLHPIGDDRLLGIGSNGRGGAQIALFDTTDLTRVKRADVADYPRSHALAGWDPRAFTWLPDKDTALTVLRKGDAVDLATVVVRDGTLHSTVRRVEYGEDAAVVRTVELADGRVALITGEDVELLDLP